MDTRANKPEATSDKTTHDDIRIGTLDTEIVPTSPAIPHDLKSGLRFRGNIVILVLGMREYGQGLYTAYFAGLVALRLGIPFRRLRVYYSATRPAVLQTPHPFAASLHESDPAPIAKGVAGVMQRAMQ
jgi:hypothetical protein